METELGSVEYDWLRFYDNIKKICSLIASEISQLLMQRQPVSDSSPRSQRESVANSDLKRSIFLVFVQ